MRNAIARRLRKLEEVEFQHRAEPGPSLVAILLERRWKHGIAEGREPEPDPQPGCYVDSRGQPLSLADVILQSRAKRKLAEGYDRARATRPA
jgi:hypothetical protein